MNHVKLDLSSLFSRGTRAPWTAVDAGVPGKWVVASVQGRRKPGERPRVLHASHAAHEEGGWDPQALASLLDARRSRSGNTVAVLSRGDYQLLLLPRPPVPATELERSVRWAIASQVDFSVDQAVLVTMELPDTQATEGQATAPSPEQQQKRLYAVVAQPGAVQAAAEAFKKAGQRLEAVDVRETAQRNIAALVESPDECLCMLRITPIGIQLTFTHRGELYLDRFIAQPVDALQGGDDFERARLIERIAQQVQMSVSHLQTHHAGLDVKRVVLCPTPVPLDLAAPLGEQVGLPVETLDLASVFDLSAVPQLQAAQEQAEYFVALGATLRDAGAGA